MCSIVCTLGSSDHAHEQVKCMSVGIRICFPASSKLSECEEQSDADGIRRQSRISDVENLRSTNWAELEMLHDFL